ncbi:hypothetical protein NMG60_11021273 [Bertholletia excelsa]
MNEIKMLASECSSGCESGWTLYFEHSFLSHRGNEFLCSDEKRVSRGEDEEEDLSMVSDASSGPPLVHEDEYCANAENGYFCNFTSEPKNRGKRKRNRENPVAKARESHSLLDDTASSPIFNFSQNDFTLTSDQASVQKTLGYSEGCCGTRFGVPVLFPLGGSAFREPYVLFQPSLPATQLQQNQWFGGKMGMR